MRVQTTRLGRSYGWRRRGWRLQGFTHRVLAAVFPFLVQTEALRLDISYMSYSLFFLAVQFTNVYRFNFTNYDLDVLLLSALVLSKRVFAQLAFTVAQEVSALRKARHEAAEGGGISPALERAGVCLLHTGLKVAAGLGLGVAVLWLFRRQIHSQTGGPELAGLFFIPLLVRRHTSPCV